MIGSLASFIFRQTSFLDFGKIGSHLLKKKLSMFKKSPKKTENNLFILPLTTIAMRNLNIVVSKNTQVTRKTKKFKNQRKLKNRRNNKI